jgi:hypothetical protein
MEMLQERKIVLEQEKETMRFDILLLSSYLFYKRKEIV